MPKHSAGLLLYRRKDRAWKFCWCIKRSFLGEERSRSVVNPQRRILNGRRTDGSGVARISRRDWISDRKRIRRARKIRQAGGKLVYLAGEDDLIRRICAAINPNAVASAVGKMIEIPEVDRGAWFYLSEAQDSFLQSQRSFLDKLTI